MAISVATPSWDLPGIRSAVNTLLDGFLQRKTEAALDGGLPAEVTRLLRGFLFAGGKRLRPVLCVIGWHAGETSGGGAPPLGVLKIAASLEMFHTFALIHDDVMDQSATRRGCPTVHRALGDRYGSEHLGKSAAILIGDLALCWSDELVHAGGLSLRQLAGILPLTDAMRAEVMYGQYLDITAGRPSVDLELALRIVRFKTGKYTVERPLQIGAALADASPDVHSALSEYALPAGEAFQLRDDLLGSFGAPGETGKPVMDDLRDGKQTALVALALRRATPDQRRDLDELIGNADLDEAGAEHVRQLLVKTGACGEIEHMIARLRDKALRALDRSVLAPATVSALTQLIDTLTTRTT